MYSMSERSLAPEFKKFMRLFAALNGPILDAPCGHGRHAISLQELGCRIVCADIDKNALEQLSYFDKATADTNRPRLELLKVDLIEGRWPFKEGQFSGAVNVHFYERGLITNIAHSVAVDGLFYVETIANRGGNFVKLPNAGEVRSILAGNFHFLHLRESHAGPPNSGKVTVRMLARRI